MGVAWPSPRFTDNADGTVTDGLTGLVWMQDAASAGPGACAATGTTMDWQAGLDHVACLNGNDYLGHSDWRMPNYAEMISLRDFGAADLPAALNGQGFVNVSTTPYWTSTTETVVNPGGARMVTLIANGSGVGTKGGNNGQVWPVRGTSNGPATVWATGQTGCWDSSGTPRACAGTGEDGELRQGAAWPSPRFTDNGDATVTDNLTGLMWTQNANSPGPGPGICLGSGVQVFWQRALDLIACLNANTYLGHSDWRLPNPVERRSLMSYQTNDFLPAGHPFLNLKTFHWTATTDAATPSQAWYFGSNVGSNDKSLNYVAIPSFSLWVWPVRSDTTPPPPAPDISVTDSVAPAGDLNVPFGDVTAGTSSDQTVTVTNDGNADLTLGDVAVADPLALPFSLPTDNCSGQVLAPAGQCTLTVRFNPPVETTQNDTFDIPSDDPDEATVTVSVSGTGTAVPTPDIRVSDSVSPTDDLGMAFGSLTVGQASAPETATLLNDGTGSLHLSGIALSGTDPGAFTLDLNGGSGPCAGETRVLAAAESCTVTVAFGPASAGAKTASLDITSDDPDEGTVSVALSGTALAVTANNPPPQPVLVYPADGQVGLPTTLTFAATRVTDPDGDPVSYALHYCTDPDPVNNCAPVQLTAVGKGPGRHAGTGVGTSLLLVAAVLAGSGAALRRRTLLAAVLALATMLLVASCADNSGGGASLLNYEVTGLTPGTDYYWAVVASDGTAETASAVSTFHTQ